MKSKIDILENSILQEYPTILEILLKDQTTQKNIIWATDNYKFLGVNYSKEKSIEIELITGNHSNVIMPRVQKELHSKILRTKDMAEVFTPSWVCNVQNNNIDDLWFGRKNVFNKNAKKTNSIHWQTTTKTINFPKNKKWKDYVKQKRLEITCGEAPYITSRYDTVSGQFIEIEDRIGFLDRKLRIVNENNNNSRDWLRAAQIAYKSTYAYEWQGDSLLLAREALLFTFIENYKYKFLKQPQIRSVRCIANIISWNIWQMDGLKCIVPLSCQNIPQDNKNLFIKDQIKYEPCQGCNNKNIFQHNGIYCLIKDWTARDKKTNQIGSTLMFVDLVGS